jgi:hypothetical protein
MRNECGAQRVANDTPGDVQASWLDSCSTGAALHTADARCPLHVAMQGVAHAAVSQLVYYAQGEYAPRTDLLRDLDRWQQLHHLIATHICPSSRTERATAAAVTMACALFPERGYTVQRNLLRCCACRERSDPCPLEGETEYDPFTSL